MNFRFIPLILFLGCATTVPNIDLTLSNSKYINEKDSATANWLSKKREECINSSKSEHPSILSKLTKTDSLDTCMKPIFEIAYKVSGLVDELHILNKKLVITTLSNISDKGAKIKKLEGDIKTKIESFRGIKLP